MHGAEVMVKAGLSEVRGAEVMVKAWPLPWGRLRSVPRHRAAHRLTERNRVPGVCAHVPGLLLESAGDRTLLTHLPCSPSWSLAWKRLLWGLLPLPAGWELCTASPSPPRVEPTRPLMDEFMHLPF